MPKIALIPKAHRQNPALAIQEAPESAAFSNHFHSDRLALQRNLTNSPGRKQQYGVLCLTALCQGKASNRKPRKS